MSDEETRQQRATKMKKRKQRDYIAMTLLDRTGPFSPKIISPKKGIYNRKKEKRKDFVDEQISDST